MTSWHRVRLWNARTEHDRPARPAAPVGPAGPAGAKGDYEDDWFEEKPKIRRFIPDGLLKSTLMLLVLSL